MPSCDELFNELLIRLKTIDRYNIMGGEPIYYLVFPVEQMLEMKRSLKVLVSRLMLDGWSPSVLSLAEVVNAIFRSDPDRQILLESEKAYLEDGDFAAINESLRSILLGTGADKVTARILKELESLQEKKGSILIIADVEALHPYLRIGAIEQRLQGRCPVPVVIFYPGNRTGNSTLQFLGIWPEDGNYRSTHIG
ncbi:MAG: hypothetical protein BWX81_00246 [Spirochaetes bacterium ADurb.Bin110]|jgi:hypothetical protein|nr:MAG: hypothetical protein BWX81_00246 [Spirochaetes bacterium ADurb.Bin110]